MKFEDRRHAGRLLAQRLLELDPPDSIVWGLPRGGVPVAYEVALALGADLRALHVAKVGHPSQPELALGAVSLGGAKVRNDQLLSQLGMPLEEFDQLADAAHQRLVSKWGAREGGAESGKGTSIIVDDGLATGASARVASSVLRSAGSSTVWLAVPVSPRGVEHSLASDFDKLVVLHQPRGFSAVGLWYMDFAQTTDEEVEDLLARSRLR